MTLTSSGDVGIGTTSPSYPLDVYGNPGTLYLEDLGVQGARIYFSGNGNGSISSVIGSNININGLEFFTNGTAISANERMVILSTGNVGIGTTGPATKLDVNGDITNENVKSCAVVGTDSNGKLICTSTTNALTLIATKTASGSASIQFTSLPATYNTLFLNCTGLVLSANAILVGYVGEGAGPTWENGAHYSQEGTFLTPASGFKQTDTTIATGFQGNSGSTTIPQSWKVYIDNVGSSSVYKMITTITSAYCGTCAGSNPSMLMSYWNNDTNAITGLELVPTSGNIASGQCSLYGMN